MRAVLDHGLTVMQERFAVLVAAGEMSQSAAYREAYPASKNWKPESVHAKASELAADRKVSARIAELRQAASKKVGLKTASILEQVRRLAESDIAGVMNADGTVKLPHELDPGTRAAVKSFKIDELGRIEYQFWDKNAALDKAMKYLGLYERDNQQQQGGLLALRDALVGRVTGVRPEAALPDDDDDVIDMEE